MITDVSNTRKIKTQKSKKILTKSVFYPIIKYVADKTKQLIAEVAELADAHGSGPCGSNTLWVRLPSSAYRLGAGNLDFIGFPATFIYRNRRYVR